MSEETTKEQGVAERICPHCQYKDFYADPMPVGTRCTSCTKAMATLVQKSTVAMAERGVHLASLDELYRFANMIKDSEAYPSWKDATAIGVAIQTGMELGFTPVTSLRSLYVAKNGGRPELYGQAALAKIRGSHNVMWVEVGTSDNAWDDDDHYGFCRIQRTGLQDECVEIQFSVAEAKRANLWMRGGGAWSNYSEDMLVWKAVARCAKRYCSDILLGVEIREAQDKYIRNVEVTEDGVVIEPREERVASDEPDPLFEMVKVEEASVEADETEAGEGEADEADAGGDERDGG